MAIMKREWTDASAREWVLAVELGKQPRGLKYCSAISYLKVAPGQILDEYMARRTGETNQE